METIKAISSTIACTLSAKDMEDVESAWQRMFTTSLASREDVPGGLRLEFHPGSADALRQLIDIERECCAWINFEVDAASVTMTAAGDGEKAIRDMWGGTPEG